MQPIEDLIHRAAHASNYCESETEMVELLSDESDIEIAYLCAVAGKILARDRSNEDSTD